MSAHFSSAHNSHRSSLQHSRQTPPVQLFLFILIGFCLSGLLIAATESYIRGVEHLRAVGVTVEGTVSETGVLQLGGRTPSYWASGNYTAISASGIELSMPFRFDVSAEEYGTIARGETVALVYDPQHRGDPQQAADLARVDTTRMRVLSVLAAVVYAVIGVGLSALEWRHRTLGSRRLAKLRGAFGMK